MFEIYEKLVELIRSGKRAIIVTVTEVSGSVPRHAGSKMIVYPDGKIFGSIGGGKIEHEVINDALELMSKEKVCKKNYALTEDLDMLCGGSVEFLFEPVGDMDKLIIFGAGHIGLELFRLAKKAGFLVSDVDNRPEFANSDRFPDVVEIFAGDYEKMLPKINCSSRTFVVIVTHGHKHDEPILHYCIQQPFAYLGMIGSKRKTLIMFKNLQEKGISGEQLSGVHSPIGLNIGTETPFEIAVSILSEIIAVRNKVAVDSLSMKIKLDSQTANVKRER